MIRQAKLATEPGRGTGPAAQRFDSPGYIYPLTGAGRNRLAKLLVDGPSGADKRRAPLHEALIVVSLKKPPF